MNAEFKISERTIETERLVLRAFEETDVDDFFEYARVEGVGERAGWKHHESKDESAQILKSFIEDDKTFAICLKENGKVIGSIGIEFYTDENELTEFDGYRGREIGYVLSKDHWGHGIMPEAVNAVINFLFGECDMDFLICGYYSFNSQSKRVQEKCGFRPYRRTTRETRLGNVEDLILSILINPKRPVRFEFSHPETLIYKD